MDWGWGQGEREMDPDARNSADFPHELLQTVRAYTIDNIIEAYKTNTQRKIEREREHYELPVLSFWLCRFIQSFHPVTYEQVTRLRQLLEISGFVGCIVTGMLSWHLYLCTTAQTSVEYRGNQFRGNLLKSEDGCVYAYHTQPQLDVNDKRKRIRMCDRHESTRPHAS